MMATMTTPAATAMSTSTAVTISVWRVMPRSSAVRTRTADAGRNAIAVAKAI